MPTSQCKVQSILQDYKSESVFPPQVANVFAEQFDEILINYQKLANWADDKKLLLLNVAPKHHYLWHLGQKIQFLKPRRGELFFR